VVIENQEKESEFQGGKKSDASWQLKASLARTARTNPSKMAHGEHFGLKGV
jgi:hypothetical protein